MTHKNKPAFTEGRDERLDEFHDPHGREKRSDWDEVRVSNAGGVPQIDIPRRSGLDPSEIKAVGRIARVVDHHQERGL